MMMLLSILQDHSLEYVPVHCSSAYLLICILFWSALVSYMTIQDGKLIIWLFAFVSQARQQSTRTAVVIIDDDSETNPEPAGLMLSPA